MLFLTLVACLLLLHQCYYAADYESTIRRLIMISVMHLALARIMFLYNYNVEGILLLLSNFLGWYLLTNYRAEKSWRRTFRYWRPLQYVFLIGFAISLGELLTLLLN